MDSADCSCVYIDNASQRAHAGECLSAVALPRALFFGCVPPLLGFSENFSLFLSCDNNFALISKITFQGLETFSNDQTSPVLSGCKTPLAIISFGFDVSVYFLGTLQWPVVHFE